MNIHSHAFELRPPALVGVGPAERCGDQHREVTSFPILPGSVSGRGSAISPTFLTCPFDITLLVCVMTAYGGSGFSSPVASPLHRKGNGGLGGRRTLLSLAARMGRGKTLVQVLSSPWALPMELEQALQISLWEEGALRGAGFAVT